MTISLQKGFVFDHHLWNYVQDIKSYEKFDYRPYINLSSNELRDDRLQELFQTFLKEFTGQQIFAYPLPQLPNQSIANYFNIVPNRLVITPGSDDGIKTVLASLATKTKRVILQTPNYENYEVYSKLLQLNITPIYWKFDNQSFVTNLLQTLMGTPPSVCILTNPSGWTGQSLSVLQIHQIAEVCGIYGHILVIDEAYTSFNDDQISPAVLPYEHVLQIHSFSKTFGLAGFRVGVLIGSEYLISYLKKWRPSNGVSRISIEFLMYLLAKLPVIEQIRNELVVRRRQFFIELGKLTPEWKAIETKANFVLLQTQESASASWLAHRMRESGIIVKHLASNDTLTAFLRITVPSKDEMEAVLTVFSDVASEWIMGKGGK